MVFVLEHVRSSSFGSKRVAVSSSEVVNGGDSLSDISSKRLCFDDSFHSTERSQLEELPQDVLVRILCGVEHEDMKSLFFVSKTIQEATLVAKQSHFAYSTPRKTVGFRNVDGSGDLNEVETPNAPKQSRMARSRLSAKRLVGITVDLFGANVDLAHGN